MNNRMWIERVLDRDRLIVLISLVAVTVIAWAWIVPMAVDMYGPMSGASAWMMSAEWDTRFVVLLFVMWAVMMAGMMLPSAAPTILVYLGAVRHNDPARATASAHAFTSGYLVMWTLFAAAAVAVQHILVKALVLTPMMQLSTNRAASVALALAGLYQLTPLKRACLSACQSPATFITKHWRPGVAGAFRMGVTHGAFCLGCCWALMLLLFAGGVMHLPTIALLTTFILIEKLLPLGTGLAGRGFTWATGSLLLALAAWMLR